MDEMHTVYDDIPDYELGKCANCQKPLSVAGERNPHNAMCYYCEDMIRTYENEMAELRFDIASGELK